MEIRAPALDKLVFMKLILKKIIALEFRSEGTQVSW